MIQTRRPARQSVLGVQVSATTYEQVVSLCRDWIAQKGTDPARYICVTSVHGIMTAYRDASFRAMLNGADIVTPDGMPVVWAMRSFGVRGQQRVYGPNLMLALCEQAAALGHRVFLYGSTEDRVKALILQLTKRFPGLKIAGHECPPFRPLTTEEEEAAAMRIRESGADLVFIGLSTPKQEAWMVRMRRRLPGVVLVGVGAAFDFHAGTVRQAPAWMQNAGLEWLFRLLMEPGRLWKRYLSIVPVFLPLWALQRAGVLRFHAEAEHKGAG